MKANQASINLIKEFEGFRAKAYLDTLASPALWTIGYGTTGRAGVGIDPKAGMVITETEAEWYLQKAVDKFAAQIAHKIKQPINANEAGAFISLAYNIGPSAFGKSSAMRKFNAGDKRGAADAILLWNKAGGKVLRGLQRRRMAERELFLTPAHLPPPVDHVPVTATHSFWAVLVKVFANLFLRKP
tara:strand:+ start:552 stop:1109 length:558 start_codon:yes stop_codon:yes gene_type:complete